MILVLYIREYSDDCSTMHQSIQMILVLYIRGYSGDFNTMHQYSDDFSML